ncbi:MAG TPA: hypothetical protein VGR63_19000 [Casimicrobiaceae bacterium]|nr:hypothetical protein [Casimicrobiaceae bacterium]
MSEKAKIGPHEQQLRNLREAQAARAGLKSGKLKVKGVGGKLVTIKASKRGK